ncbi:MAG: PucR family transcriptional regulator ligand-binding domain-containing protein [Actinomycetaceae bacterium]|nr:PucR family transcriptional regulator ligand-binding domain-containing protein [Arcanobacterium sp.]MDD7504540.1 PucR family transcriptional regulator ligand-binding domain-containing protein [Actinomycetaceae bacterium]MDY6143183.1 PucR family transcriptional regulator ligand-binding domain-containing protein [Arcanobacterium sp.]
MLERPEFSGARVLAGQDNLDRDVAAVTVAEIPDIARWLSGNDFVHGVGRVFALPGGGVDESAMHQWINELIDGGAACFAIKTHRYIDEVPPSVIKLGNDKGFPIIELPDGTVQAQVSEIIYQMIMDAGLERERKRTELFTAMVRDVMGPHVLSHDATKMAEHLHRPIAILSSTYEFLGTSFSDDAADAAISQSNPLIDMQSVQAGVKHAVTSGALLPSVGVTPEQNVFYAEYDDSSGSSHEVIVLEITYASETLGYACMIGDSTPFDPDEIYFFASLAEVLTIDMSKEIMVETSVLLSRSEFFSVISGQNVDERRALYLADLIGLNYAKPMRAMVISVDSADANFASGSSMVGETKKKAVRYVAQHLRAVLRPEEKWFACTWERGVAVVFSGEAHTPERFSALGEALVKGLTASARFQHVRAGIGQAGTGIEGIHESAQNALYALNSIDTFSLSEQVIRYDELGPYLFLSAAMCSAEASQKYVDFVLGPLLNQESEYRDELLETLSVYLKTRGSYSAAAKELNMHVNSVRYRVSKIAQLLPVDLETSDGTGSVWLAMRIHTLLSNNNPNGAPKCG